MRSIDSPPMGTAGRTAPATVADGMDTSSRHGEYSHYSVFIMFRHLALHDFFHAYRIEELLLKKTWA